jgi:hypothetical protein
MHPVTAGAALVDSPSPNALCPTIRSQHRSRRRKSRTIVRFPRSRWAKTASTYSSGCCEHANCMQCQHFAPPPPPRDIPRRPEPGEGQRACAASTGNSCATTPHGDPSGRFAEFNRDIRSSGRPPGEGALALAAPGWPDPHIFGVATSNGSSPVRSPQACSEASLRIFTPNFPYRLHSHLILYCGAFRLVRPILCRRRPARPSIRSIDGGIGLPDQARHAPAGGST